jgi:hypothetical protein
MMMMSTRPEVIRELRVLFKEGATPSRLIRHIVARHPGESSWHALIQDYFLEAFGVPIVRGLQPFDNYRHADLRYAFLNEHLIHEILEKHAQWDQEEGQHKEAISWLDSTQATDKEELLKQAQAAIVPELADCWERLDLRERSFIQRTMASANGLYEEVKVLARLAEQLQQKIVELQDRVPGPKEEDKTDAA